MIENHEILCPTFIECNLCQRKRDEINRSRITKLFGIDEDIQILSKHFYHLTISVKPTRETYHHFSLDPFKKTGRELINGLSSISSVSNRSWWNLFVKSGCRYYSIDQKDENDYPTFNNHFLFYGDKDNIDCRMNIQLKYRLRKISKSLTYTFEYLGQYDTKKIQDSIKIGVSVNYESTPIMKLGDEIRDEIYKIKEQRPITFGDKYNKKTTNKLEKNPN
jgi:hypothetical protein